MNTHISTHRQSNGAVPRLKPANAPSTNDVPPAAVLVDSLDVVRGSKPILHDLSLNVPPGSITGLLGPSGSGKTTLLRAIVGVQRISAGTVYVLGVPAGSPALRRDVGYVTQTPSVYEDVTVLHNVRYFASLYGLGRRHAQRVIEEVGLAEQSSQLAGSLSGGQRSRCSLACALVAEPKVLVLDEPTAGQDPLVREQLWAQFQDLARSGVAIIVSSHVMAEAARCDQLVLIRDGRVAAEGTPAQLRARTGASDMDEAFLALARAQAVA